MFRKAACCKECNKQYALPGFSLFGKIKFDCTCQKCSENLRKCKLLTHQTELEKENNEGKRLTIQQEKESNEGKRLIVEQEKEKRLTLCQQQKHDLEEAEKRRLHEIEVETKKSETTIADRNIEAEKELKKFEIQQSMCNKCELQKQHHRHEAQMQEKRNEEKHLELKIQEQRTEEKRLELEMQGKRNEEKSLELKCLQMRLQLKEESGSLVRSRNVQRRNSQLATS